MPAAPAASVSSVITPSSWSWRRLAAMRHALEARLARQRRQRRLVERHVERDDRAVAALGQRVRLDDGVGQHRQLVARHVDRRQAVARDLRRPREPGATASAGAAMWMPSVTWPRAEALHRERVVDLGRRRVVDRERLRRGASGSFSPTLGTGSVGEADALRELLEQEAAPVELVRRVDRAGRLQQVERRPLRAPRRPRRRPCTRARSCRA